MLVVRGETLHDLETSPEAQERGGGTHRRWAGARRRAGAACARAACRGSGRWPRVVVGPDGEAFPIAVNGCGA